VVIAGNRQLPWITSFQDLNLVQAIAISSKMEEWYEQQSYFSEERLTRIQAWMSDDLISLLSYNVDILVPNFAAG